MAVAVLVVVVAVVPAPGEAASTWGTPVAAVAGAEAVDAAAEAAARQGPVEVVEGVQPHSLPVVVAEFLRVVAVAAAAEAVVDLAAGDAVGAVVLHHKASGFRRGLSVERGDPSESVCGVLSIARVVPVFPSVPIFVAQRCWLVHPNWRYHSHRGPPFWEAQIGMFRHRCCH